MTDGTELHGTPFAERRQQMARSDHETLFSFRNAEYAERYGVTRSQITQDKRSSEYNDALAALQANSGISRITAKSWALLEAIIDDGLQARTDEMPEFEGKPKEIINKELHWDSNRQKKMDRGLKGIQEHLRCIGAYGDPGSNANSIQEIRDIINKTEA